MTKMKASMIVVVLSLAGATRAAEIETIAGADWDTKAQGYQAVGAGVLSPLNDRWTVFGRLSASRVRYTYDAGSASLTGNILALGPSVGARYRIGTLNLGLASGIDIRHTRRTTVAGGFEDRDETGASVQADLDLWFAKVYDLSVISSFASAGDFFWARGRLKRQVTNLDYARPISWFVGVESVGDGNSDFHSYQLGGVVECAYRPLSLSAAIKGGYKYSTGYRDTGYAGVELYYRR